MAHWSRKLQDGFWIGLGYMLSPLSWWNDAFFNLPIALAFGYAIRWLHTDWFLPGTVVGYWLSNVVGIVMMQLGATDLFFSADQRHLKRDLIIGIGSSTLYTIAVSLLVYFGVLQTPDF